MHCLANLTVYLTLESRVVGDMVGHSLLYVYILNLGNTCALRNSTLDMVLRIQEIKASLKDGKQSNLVTTCVGSAVRGKTNATQGSAVPGPSLFTYNKRNGIRCFLWGYHQYARELIIK